MPISTIQQSDPAIHIYILCKLILIPFLRKEVSIVLVNSLAQSMIFRKVALFNLCIVLGMLCSTFETIYKKISQKTIILGTSPLPSPPSGGKIMGKINSANIFLYYLLGVRSYLS